MNRIGLVSSAGLLVSWLALTTGCAEQAAPIESTEQLAPVEASASVDHAVATTGDVLTFRISVDHDPSLVVEIPEAGAEIQGFRIVDTSREEPVEAAGRVTRELVYRLRADLVGSYVLPSVAVSYRAADGPEGEADGVVETSQIFVEVESVLPEDGSAEDIVELKPLRQIERQRPWWFFAGLAAGALVIAVLLWRYLRRSREITAAPPEAPHVVAFRALDLLRETDFADVVAVRRFYFAISETLRTYVEGRFGLNATDLTTEEILAQLPVLSDLGETERDALRRFLAHTDQVKFAEHQPSEAEIEQTYEAALDFVETTQERPEDDEPQELAA